MYRICCVKKKIKHASRLLQQGPRSAPQAHIQKAVAIADTTPTSALMPVFFLIPLISIHLTAIATSWTAPSPILNPEVIINADLSESVAWCLHCGTSALFTLYWVQL